MRYALAMLVLVGCSAPRPSSPAVEESPQVVIPTELVRVPPAFIALSHGRGLDVSATGIIHVVSADPNVISMYAMDGTPAGTIGGSGTRAGSFNNATDIEAGSGLFVTVADRGNGRIQRFGRDGGVVEVIPIDAGASGSTPYFSVSDDLGGSGTGQPVAIVETPSGGLVIVEERSGRLLLLDRLREQLVIAGENVVRDPLDVAVFGRGFVALDGHHHVVVFDALGTVVRTVRTLRLDRLASALDGIVGVRDLSIVLFNKRLEPVVELLLDLPGGAILDVHQSRSELLVLTDAGVHRIPVDSRWIPPAQ